jgi:hypothetical protein
MMMKDAERAVFTGGSVTWKKSQDSISLDSKSFLNSILNIYSSSTNQSRNTKLSDLPEWWIEQIRSTIYFLTTYQINQSKSLIPCLNRYGIFMRKILFTKFQHHIEDITMIKGLAITPPVLGRISIGKIVEKNGKRLPEKDDQFTITSQIQNKDGWVKHPLDEQLRAKAQNQKLRTFQYV